MTRRSIYCCVVALFVVAGFMSDGLAQGRLPGPLATELTQYPGSKVLNANVLPGNNFVANMNFGEASVSEVYSYYKNKMIKNGFTIQAEVGGATIIGKKGHFKGRLEK